MRRPCSIFFLFNDTATTEIYSLSLHDALPISDAVPRDAGVVRARGGPELVEEAPVHRPVELSEIGRGDGGRSRTDRKSTRLNSSHLVISYAVFCFKKKKK